MTSRKGTLQQKSAAVFLGAAETEALDGSLNENFKQLPKDMLPYIVEPSTLEDMPADLDPSSVWVLDH